ncbi:MAG: MFS transporter [Fimbriimonadaceae bacterium]
MSPGTLSARYGKVVLVVGFLLHLQLGIAYSYAVLRPHLERAFDLDGFSAGLGFSAILVGYTVGMVWGGIWNDRRGPRVVTPVGAFMFGTGFALAGIAPSYPVFLVAYGGVCGVGTGLAYIAAVQTAVRWHPTRRGTATGAVVLGFGLSSVFFAPTIHLLASTYGWRTAMVGLGAVFLVAGTALALAVREPEGPRPEAPASAEFLGKDPRFRRLWVAWFLVLTVGLAWLGQLPALGKEYGLSAGAAAYLVSAVALANGTARPFLGLLSDRIGRTRCLALASAVGATTLAALAVVASPVAVWVAGFLVGVVFAAWLVNLAPIAAERFGSGSAGRAYGRLFTAYGAGGLIGPPLLGAVVQAGGGHRPGLLLSAAVLALGGWAFATADRIRRTPEVPKSPIV